MHSPPDVIRVAVLSNSPVVIAGVTALLGEFRDRVVVVDLDSVTPGLTDQADIVMVDLSGDLAVASSRLCPDQIRTKAKAVDLNWGNAPDTVRRSIVTGTRRSLSMFLDARALVETIHAERDDANLRRKASETAESTAPWAGERFEFTQREIEVLDLVSQGLSNQEVAERLCLSVNTIKSHFRKVYRKTGVHTRAQIVLWALKYGFPQTVTHSPTSEHLEQG